jgi:hypothetical protein
MLMPNPLKILLFGLLTIAIAASSAQSLNCPEIVNQALEAAEGFCSELGRNQACYGNIQLTAQPQANVSSFNFSTTGDIVNAGDIYSLDLSPLDVNSGNWGVALMSLQADIPNTLPGQNITFILFGDVELMTAASEGQSPMQAFYLRTGIGAMACEEAPESGLLIQSPEGIEEISFNINGVDMKIGSTVLFQTKPVSEQVQEMIISTVEGTGVVSFDGEVYPVLAGTRTHVPLNAEYLPIGRPSLPEAYEAGRFDNLPIDALPDDIEIAPPFPNMALLHERLLAGLPPCDVEGLPACEDLPPVVRNGTGTRWGQEFVEGQNCLLRPLEVVDATSLPPVIGAERPSVPFCPPINRASRPLAPANIVLALTNDEDADGILNQDDACPYLVGIVELQGCPETPPDRDGDGLSDGLDLCPYRAGTNRGCPEVANGTDTTTVVDNQVSDRDNDGFADANDACPDVFGTNNGCPPPNDSDGDTVLDANDRCPSVFGLVELNGCPAPDADGDGVPDSRDQCPNEMGSADMGGCPLPYDPADGDQDGVPDSQDQCPREVGTAEYSGCPPPVGRGDTPSDRDGDTVPDNQDQCPDVAGSPNNSGCPLDRDGDGVIDNQDKCPDEYGSPDNFGCPIRDLDQDGVPDSNDECPRVPGDPNNYGCPLPDRDGDGVPDAQDRCPDVAGPVDNAGCPLRRG